MHEYEVSNLDKPVTVFPRGAVEGRSRCDRHDRKKISEQGPQGPVGPIIQSYHPVASAMNPVVGKPATFFQISCGFIIRNDKWWTIKPGWGRCQFPW